MRRLKVPTDDALQVFKLCLSAVQNADLRNRLTAIEQDIATAALSFLNAASNTKLHTLEKQHAINSQWTYGPIVINGKIPLMKLHGSLNWEAAGFASLPVIRRYIDCRPNRGRRYNVLLVPPQGSAETSLLRPIWTRSAELLMAAQTWVICGYSIPEYDTPVSDLLVRSLRGNVEKIVICDPAARAVRAKLHRLLSKPVAIVELPGLTADFGKQAARELTQILSAN